LKNFKTYYVLFATLSLLGLSGCTSASVSLDAPSSTHYTTSTQYEEATPEKMARYQQTMKSVAAGISNDADYQRITLDTPEKKTWFRNLTYRLWDRQMTRQQFMVEGLAKYPTHKHEFDFIIDGFARACQSN